jgi:hypothetical protein
MTDDRLWSGNAERRFLARNNNIVLDLTQSILKGGTALRLSNLDACSLQTF